MRPPVFPACGCEKRQHEGAGRSRELVAPRIAGATSWKGDVRILKLIGLER